MAVDSVSKRQSALEFLAPSVPIPDGAITQPDRNQLVRLYSGISAAVGIAGIFTPPTVSDMGPVNPDTVGIQRRLFGYYDPHPRGVNVWKLPDGTYTQVQPWPLVNADDVRHGELPIGTTATVQTYVLVYYGGHSYAISAAEQAALTTAGYGAYIT